MSNLRKKTSVSSLVVITGCQGFLGSRLAKALIKNKIALLGIDRVSGRKMNIDFLRADLLKKEDASKIKRHLKKRGYKDLTLIHLAGVPDIKFFQRSVAPEDDSNVLLLRNAIDALKGFGLKRVILSSSALIYGTKHASCVTEESPLRPENAYAESKLASEGYLFAAAERYSFSAAILRLTNVYGPGMNANTVVATIIGQLKRGRLNLKEYTSRRDFLYIEDAVSAFIKALRNPRESGIYNVGTGKGCTIYELAKTAAGIMGKVSCLPQRKTIAANVSRLVVSPRKMRIAFGWNPQHDLKQGLTKTIDCYA